MKTHWLAVTALFFVATAWGATFTLVKSALAQIAPEPFIVFRFLLAGAILLLLAFAVRQLPRAAIVPGAILGLFGTALLIGGVDARPTVGDLLTIGCAVCSALHVVLSAKYSVDKPALGLAAVQVIVVGVAAAPASAFAPRVTWSREVAFTIVFTAIVTTALAFVALMWGQARVTATEAAVILAFEPVAASITSIVFGHEPVTTMFVTGAALILMAIVLSQLPESPRRDPLAQ